MKSKNNNYNHEEVIPELVSEEDMEEQFDIHTSINSDSDDNNDEDYEDHEDYEDEDANDNKDDGDYDDDYDADDNDEDDVDVVFLGVELQVDSEDWTKTGHWPTPHGRKTLKNSTIAYIIFLNYTINIIKCILLFNKPDFISHNKKRFLLILLKVPLLLNIHSVYMIYIYFVEKYI